MSDFVFIDSLEKNAKVFLEWCRQQKELPGDERDILEYRFRDEWRPVRDGFVPWHQDEYRLRKRIKKHTATVYWYRYSNGAVSYRLSPVSVLADTKFLGTNTVEFTEPQE